eukprot:jgi/Phyca11/114661/e_gw1.26.378.1
MTTWLVSHFPDSVDDLTQQMRVPLSKDAVLGYFGYICAPAHTCDQEDVRANDASKLRRVIDGYEKVINSLKKRGLMKINEGKRQLKIRGFDLLSVKLMTITPVKKGQSWATVLFGWSYFWTDDCLVVEEQGHKGDQTGADKFGKHVYANPFEPSQCTVLALAVHLFCYPERGIGGRQQLFIGTDNKNRFGRMLHRIIGSLSEEDKCILGCNPDDIGTHSLRKGSSSYALGQSLGKLKDRYIHFGEGADQLCGRMIAGLPFNSERFGVCTSSFSVFTIHHEQYLRTMLNPCHPIFKSRIFTANNLLQLQRGSTILAVGVSTVCGLKATGIPAHLAVATQVNALREQVDHLHREIHQLKTDISSKVPNEVAQHVVSELRQHFVVNGVAPVSLRDIDTRISELRASMVMEFRSALNSGQGTHSNEQNNSTSGPPQWQTFQ